MRPKIREILEECIEKGIEYGYLRAHKHHPDPPDNHIFSEIDDAIWYEIDERFDFERNLYSEVVEGLDHLPKHLRPKILHNLDQEEVDRLREKKKQIYEDLKDAVDREWVGLTDKEKNT